MKKGGEEKKIFLIGKRRVTVKHCTGDVELRSQHRPERQNEPKRREREREGEKAETGVSAEGITSDSLLWIVHRVQKEGAQH